MVLRFAGTSPGGKYCCEVYIDFLKKIFSLIWGRTVIYLMYGKEVGWLVRYVLAEGLEFSTEYDFDS